MAGFQKITIIGNLGRDPEMRYTPDGTPVTTLSVATNRKWNNADGTKGEETTWFQITAWRKLAETTAKYLKKGRQIMVEGRLSPDKATGGPRVWTRRDGTPGAAYEVVAGSVLFLDGNGNHHELEPSGAASGPDLDIDFEGTEPIPF